MVWKILSDEDFSAWFETLDEAEQDEISAGLVLLSTYGPQLGRPRVDSVRGSQYSNMKELRLQIAGSPWRILFAFDPERAAILLVGGNKSGAKRWYETNVPIADARFQRHLDNLGDGG